MENFYVDLDTYNQVTPSQTERQILLIIGILFGMGSVFLFILGLTQTDIYLVISLVNALLCLGLAIGAIYLYRGRNLYSLPLGTFFLLNEEKISYKFSLFSKVRQYNWAEIKKAEMSMFVIYLWIGNEFHEIDLQEVKDKGQQRILKQKFKEALKTREFLQQPA
ncbi:hypothetical protein [Xanthocytophaga agilis]|uniref:YcxB-like protein domain-containing protein n=1 Tax=Xanthocytophaga agilis TaxID=3048010 RepID=A0AAE3R5V8_9BACT|nr:hypothetical protein [Xanthocytophaga agilis]MDJ1502167.1 hypothetical protein [Xanthocytophaga agilis]